MPNRNMFNLEAEDVWKRLWKSKLHECIKLHLWRGLADVIPTSGLIDVILEANCVICGVEEETCFHLFKYCQLARSIAFGCRWNCHVDQLLGDNIKSWTKFCLVPNQLLRDDTFFMEWCLVFLT